MAQITRHLISTIHSASLTYSSIRKPSTSCEICLGPPRQFFTKRRRSVSIPRTVVYHRRSAITYSLLHAAYRSLQDRTQISKLLRFRVIEYALSPAVPDPRSATCRIKPRYQRRQRGP